MNWIGVILFIAGVCSFLSNKRYTGISIGGKDVHEETGKQYGQGCLLMVIGGVVAYFASK